MKLDYCLLSVAAVVCICHFGDSNSQQIIGTDDAANVGRDLDLYFLDDEDSREPSQQPQLSGHHLRKREAPVSSKRPSTTKKSSKKEPSYAEALMGSGDSEASEDTEDSSKTFKHPESDDEDEDDIQGSGDIFNIHKTTKRPRVSTPPPIKGEVQPSTTTAPSTTSTTTEQQTSTSTTTTPSTTTTALPTTMRTPASSKRPALGTTLMPEDDEDSEDEGDYEGSGAGELPISKGSLNTPAKASNNNNKNKEKPKSPVDDYGGSEFTDDDDLDEDDDDDDDDDETDEDVDGGGDLLTTPRSSNVPLTTAAPSTTTSPTPSTTTESKTSTTSTTTTTEFIPITQSTSTTSSTTPPPVIDKDDDSTGDDDEDTDEDDTLSSEKDHNNNDDDDKDTDVKHNKNKPDTVKPIIPEKPNKHPGGDDSRGESRENNIDHEEDNKINVGEGLLERHKATPRPSTLLGQPGILVAIMGGAVVGLLLAILCVMFVVYRMRKKDEGSYPLNKRTHDDHFSTHRRNYMRPSANKEFYA